MRAAGALLAETSERVLAFVAEVSGNAFATVRQRLARHLLDLASERQQGPELMVTDDVLDVTLEHASRITSPRSAITAWQLGGAVARIGELETFLVSGAVPRFLVEVFAPRLGVGDLAAAEERARAAATRISARNAVVRHLRATYEDETCFHVFEAPSAELVAQAGALAGFGGGRIVQALEINASPFHKRGRA